MANEEVTHKTVGGAIFGAALWGSLALAFGAATVLVFLGRRASVWGLITFASLALIAVMTFIGHLKEAKALRSSSTREGLAKYRGLKGENFDDACRELAADGFRTSEELVTLADPRTWGKKQRVVSFLCPIKQPAFVVTLREKSLRVSKVSVTLN